MAKINIKVTLISEDDIKEENYHAIFQKEEDVITYQEQDQTITKINKKGSKLRRENKELIMEFSFDEGKETLGKLHIKNLNKNLNLKVKTNKILKEENKLEIEYELENQKYTYKLEVI